MRLKDFSGFSLVQVLVSAGIMMVVMLALISFMSSLQNEVRSLKQKLASVDLEKQLQQALVNSPICTQAVQTGNYLFDSTNPDSSVELPGLRISTQPGAPFLVQPGTDLVDLTVDKIHLKE